MKRFLIFLLPLAFLGGAAYWLYPSMPVPPPPPPPPPPRDYKGVATYLDASLSMVGYFRTTKEHGSIIQRFLWVHLLQVIRGQLSDEPVYFGTFGEAVPDPEELRPTESLLNRLKFPSAKARKEYFGSRQTRLVELLSTDQLRKSKVFVVVTDGLPSSPGQAGIDSRLMTQLQSLDREGVNLWLIGLRSEFRGRVYPETPDAFGQKGSFDHSGVRPIYLWIGARDMAIGTDIVEGFIEAIRSLAEKQDGARVEVVQLTEPEKLNPAVVLNVDALQEVLTIENEDHLEMRLARGFNAPFSVHMTVTGLEEKFPREKEFHWVIDASRKNAVAVIRDENDKWTLRVDPTKTSSFEIELNVVAAMTPWWKFWSTNDDSVREHADKTLHLSEMIDVLTKGTRREYLSPKLRVELK
ncbi:hypothetical protein [Pelagibius sp. Alg239-R121]|uniref:hypothetical protein n=1 Tax=Pelagibius sp. Alg239-R121 TaxID=2993448 RepID=UPI0024A76F16|nr:hypothetical protein [Pelagibius sp. Alg239-R121]